MAVGVTKLNNSCFWGYDLERSELVEFRRLPNSAELVMTLRMPLLFWSIRQRINKILTSTGLIQFVQLRKVESLLRIHFTGVRNVSGSMAIETSSNSGDITKVSLPVLDKLWFKITSVTHGGVFALETDEGNIEFSFDDASINCVKT
jgi:hypothetical protein